MKCACPVPNCVVISLTVTHLQAHLITAHKLSAELAICGSIRPLEVAIAAARNTPTPGIRFACSCGFSAGPFQDEAAARQKAFTHAFSANGEKHAIRYEGSAQTANASVVRTK